MSTADTGKSRLLDVWLIDSKRLPPWRQQTGSGRPEPLCNTTSALLPPRWNMVEIDGASLGQSESVKQPHRRV